MTLTTWEFTKTLIQTNWHLLLLAVVLIFNDRVILIIGRLFFMTKRQLKKQQFTEKILKKAEVIEHKIMHSYLLEEETNLRNHHT